MFVINQTQGTVDYFGGAVVIPRDGYVELTDEQLAEVGVQATKNLGWVKFSETKPEAVVSTKPEIVFETAEDDGGSTEYPGAVAPEPVAPELVAEPEPVAPELVAEPEPVAPEPVVKKAGKKAVAVAEEVKVQE